MKRYKFTTDGIVKEVTNPTGKTKVFKPFKRVETGTQFKKKDFITTDQLNSIVEKLASNVAAQVIAGMPEQKTVSRTSKEVGLDSSAFGIDETLVVSNTADITDIEQSNILSETSTTKDASMQSAKDKLLRLKKGK